MSRFLLAFLLILPCVPASARTHLFHAYLTGAQEVPANASTARGTGRFVYDDVTGILGYSVQFSGLAANANGAHIHSPAPRGANISVSLATTPPAATSGTIAGSSAINATVAGHILSGQAYFNIHNATFAGGEIRGQLMRSQPWSDFDGSGGTDIFWSSTTQGRAIWTLDGTTVTSSALIYGPGDWRAHSVGDFNGDGRSDVLWINPNAVQTAIWLMNGTAPTAGAVVFEGPWTPAREATVDFNGDGKSDLYFTGASGDSAIWLMDGLTATQSALLFSAGSNVFARFFGDFNGDGKTDIIYENQVASEFGMVLMDGVSPISGQALFNSIFGYAVRSVGDFNGDGKDDLLLANQSSGEVAIWLMDGASVVGSSLVYGGAGGWYPVNLNRAADFDGDGKADILYGNGNGSHGIWLMDGLMPTASSAILGPGTWQVRIARDFNADGRTDILWMNPATGNPVALWIMNGLGVLDSALIYGGGSDWFPAMSPVD